MSNYIICAHAQEFEHNYSSLLCFSDTTASTIHPVFPLVIDVDSIGSNKWVFLACDQPDSIKKRERPK